MFTTTLLRRHAPSIACQPAICCLRPTFVTRKFLASPQWLRPALKRCESTAVRAVRRPAYAYPELVNVYLAPSQHTAFAGVIRVATIGVFIAGSLWVAPSWYWDEGTPLWTVPLVAIGATVPFGMSLLLGRGMITSIRIVLPRHARNSKEDLMRFANNIPPNTRLRVQFFRSVPWLINREMYFSELRRLTLSRWRLDNLEYVGAAEVERMRELSWWSRGAMKWYFCRYWVNMAARDRSAVKGAWEKMWVQIPVVRKDGTSSVAAGAGRERKPSVMRNRTSNVQSATPARTPSVSRTRR